MLMCEICGTQIKQQEDDGRDLEMAILGVCEECRKHFVQSME